MKILFYYTYYKNFIKNGLYSHNVFEGKWSEFIITEKKHITQKYLLLKDRKIMIQRATDRTFYITKDSNYIERYIPLESKI